MLSLWVHQAQPYSLVLHLRPCAMLSIPVSPAPPHSISEQKGRWQLTPGTGDRGRGGGKGREGVILVYQVLR